MTTSIFQPKNSTTLFDVVSYAGRRYPHSNKLTLAPYEQKNSGPVKVFFPATFTHFGRKIIELEATMYHPPDVNTKPLQEIVYDMIIKFGGNYSYFGTMASGDIYFSSRIPKGLNPLLFSGELQIGNEAHWKARAEALNDTVAEEKPTPELRAKAYVWLVENGRAHNFSSEAKGRSGFVTEQCNYGDGNNQRAYQIKLRRPNFFGYVKPDDINSLQEFIEKNFGIGLIDRVWEAECVDRRNL